MRRLITFLIFSAMLSFAQITPIPTSSSGGGTVYGPDAIGAVPTENPVWVVGFDGSHIRALTTDTNGYLKVLIQNGSLAVTGTFWQSTQPVSIASMPSTPVTGTFWQTTQPVSGTFWQSIQPVSGTVTVNTISGFALETGGNLASIKTNTDKIPALGQALAASSVPVVLTATQLTTLTPPAALTNFALETGGNLASIKTDVDKIPSQGQALAAGSMPVVLPAAQITTLTPPTTVATTAADGSNVVLGAKADAKNTATDITPLTMMQVLKQISASVQAPPSQAVTGTFWQSTQPVSIASMPSTPVTGTFWQSTQPVSIATMPSTPVTGTFWQTTQPVSGTVTANATLAAETTKVIGTVNVAGSQTIGLAAGAAVIGHVINDANASVVIGKVAVDQTTPGTTNAVEVTGSTDSSIGLTSTSKAAVTTAVNVKSSAGNVYGVFILNGAIATCWLELINSATAGSLGTGVIMNIPMASGGIQYLQFNPPIGGFTSGIAVGSASAIGGASACGTAATGVTVIYK